MPPKKVIHFGLAAAATQEQKDAGFTKEKVQTLVKEGADKATQAGYQVQLTYCEIETFDTTLEEFRETLQNGDWDAIIFGGGIRLASPLTAQFEKVVNVAHEVAPKAVFLFQQMPGDIYEVLQRWYG